MSSQSDNPWIALQDEASCNSCSCVCIVSLAVLEKTTMNLLFARTESSRRNVRGMVPHHVVRGDCGSPSPSQAVNVMRKKRCT